MKIADAIVKQMPFLAPARRKTNDWISPMIKRIEGSSYRTLYFEIVGTCNARCRWCTTGISSPGNLNHPAMIDTEQFQTTLEALLANHITTKTTTVHLFNWGEPMLHPRLNDLLQILKSYGLRFTLSTNASKFVVLDAGVLPYLSFLRFSVSGFSQESYARVNRLDFQNVLNNLRMFSEDIHAKSPHTNLEMAYLLYQFNITEAKEASAFCQLHNIRFVPSAAFLNDFGLAKSYLNKTMAPGLLRSVDDDLILDYVADLINQMPPHYRCPQFDMLTVDEHCDLLTCCCLPKGHPSYLLGPITNLDKKTIQNRKTSQSICSECMKAGVSWWFHHPKMMGPIDLGIKG